MKVFISWSGDTSHKIARILRDWLPTVIYYIEPWVSSEDIKKGERWSAELSKQLEEMHLGIICVDSTNSKSPWLNFEAGALSKSLDSGKVFPILFKMKPAELSGPISQFQLTLFEKEDFYRLIKSINTLSTSRIDSERLSRLFEISWLGLINALKDVQISSDQNEEIPNKIISSVPEKQAVVSTLKSTKLRIMYGNKMDEEAVNIKKFFTNLGGDAELVRIEPGKIIERNRVGVLHYRNPNSLETAVEIKNILGQFGFEKIKRDISIGAEFAIWLL